MFYMGVWDRSVCCVILIGKKTTQKSRAPVQGKENERCSFSPVLFSDFSFQST